MPSLTFHRLWFLSDLAARFSHAHMHFLQKVLNARQAIYNLGKTLKSVTVEHILKEKSLVPMMVRVSNPLLYNTQKDC